MPRPRLHRLTRSLAAFLPLLAAPATRAGDLEVLDRSLAQVGRAAASPGSATPELCAPLLALAEQEPRDPVFLAHAGSCLTLAARDARQQDEQRQLAGRGIGMVDRALAMLGPEHDEALLRGVPESIEVRVAAVELFMSLPEFLGRRPAGEQALKAALASPALPRAPEAYRLRLERYQGALAAEPPPAQAAPPELPGAVIGEIADLAWEDGATVRVPGGFTLVNNQWNRNANGRKVTPYQDVFRGTGPGGAVLGWRWSWSPDNQVVVAYPEIVRGTKPWDVPGDQAFPQGGPFPFPAGAKRVRARFDVDLQARGTYNLAFELWAVKDLAHPLRTISHEIMIWTDRAGPLAPAGEPAGSVKVGGVRFDAFVRRDHGDASGNAPNRWTFVTFVAERPMRRGELELSAFLDWCLAQKLLDRGAWITSVELGNEVVAGSGYAVLRDFAVTVR